jgi:hypothetical protein
MDWARATRFWTISRVPVGPQKSACASRERRVKKRGPFLTGKLSNTLPMSACLQHDLHTYGDGKVTKRYRAAPADQACSMASFRAEAGAGLTLNECVSVR